MGKAYLSEFEELILTTVGILGEEAYGNAIVAEIWNQVERKVNLNTVHITLYKLEDKELVKSHFGGSTSARGGRRKRLYSITNTGLNFIRKHQENRLKLWSLIPNLKLRFV